MIWTPEQDRKLVEYRMLHPIGVVAEMLGVTVESARKRYKRIGKNSSNVSGGTLEVEGAPKFPDWKVPEKPSWREWNRLFDDVLKLHKRADAICERITIDLSQVDEMALVSASDLHMGGGFTSHSRIKTTIEYILDTPGVYVGISGDTIEGFIPGMKGAGSSDQMAGSIGAQLHAMDDLVDELTAAGKLLWVTWGDHDAKWFEDRVGINVVKRLIDRKVPYFQGRGLVRLLVGKETYFIHVNHGEKYSSMWNATHPQRRMYERFFPADVTISGHLHKPAYHVEWLYNELKEFGFNLGGKTIFVQNGTFKTGPDPYSTRWWSRGIMGVPTLVFYGDTHDKDIMENPEKAVALLRGLKDD